MSVSGGNNLAAGSGSSLMYSGKGTTCSANGQVSTFGATSCSFCPGNTWSISGSIACYASGVQVGGGTLLPSGNSASGNCAVLSSI